MKTFKEYINERSYGSVELGNSKKEYIMYFKGSQAEDLTYEINSEFSDEEGWEYDEKDKSITVLSKNSDVEIAKILKKLKITPLKVEELDFKLVESANINESGHKEGEIQTKRLGKNDGLGSSG